jgi:hypothetical protein
MQRAEHGVRECGVALDLELAELAVGQSALPSRFGALDGGIGRAGWRVLEEGDRAFVDQQARLGGLTRGRVLNEQARPSPRRVEVQHRCQ